MRERSCSSARWQGRWPTYRSDEGGKAMPVDQWGNPVDLSMVSKRLRGLAGRLGDQMYAQNQRDILAPTNLYRKQLEETVYGGAGRALSSGLQGINAWAAGAGPLGDSGARAAMQSPASAPVD